MEIGLIKTLIKNKRIKAYGSIAFDITAKLYDKIKEWDGRGRIPTVIYDSKSRDTVVFVADILTKDGYEVTLASPPEKLWVTIREE